MLAGHIRPLRRSFTSRLPVRTVINRRASSTSWGEADDLHPSGRSSHFNSRNDVVCCCPSCSSAHTSDQAYLMSIHSAEKPEALAKCRGASVSSDTVARLKKDLSLSSLFEANKVRCCFTHFDTSGVVLSQLALLRLNGVPFLHTL